MIRFLLNNTPVDLDGVAPTLSLLQYLRTTLALTGTKEGCAAGDCGACTVALAVPQGDQLRYLAINACITPVAAVHGCRVLTVEHLAKDGALHPVQQAMVDCHGSQCGFCTPGVVMSLYTWRHDIQTGAVAEGRAGLATALSGNLCRCTGYQPIFRAAEQALRVADAGCDSTAVIQRLSSLQSAAGGDLSCGAAHFFAPTSSAELAELLAAWPQARLTAGATDVALEFTQELQLPAVVIGTHRVSELLALRETADSFHVGAAVTFSRLQPFIASNLPAFSELLDRLGSLQIRNRATLGGNVANASPIGDTPPVLLALDAHLNLRSLAGTRSLPIDAFFTGYRATALHAGEFIESLDLPKLAAGEALCVYKVSKRFDDDIAAVCLAIWLKREAGVTREVRIGCGGMAATPARAYHAEAALRDRPFDEAAVAAAAAALARDFTPIDDLRASSAYRLAVAGNLLLRASLELAGVPVRLHVARSTGGAHA